MGGVTFKKINYGTNIMCSSLVYPVWFSNPINEYFFVVNLTDTIIKIKRQNTGSLAKVNCRIIVNYEPHKSSRTYRSSTGKGIPHDMVRTILPTSYISIIKDDDEWFYVRDFYQETTYQKDKRIKEDIEYYKCDQLDGLLDCIHACINK
jgi:hypothetical protein